MAVAGKPVQWAGARISSWTCHIVGEGMHARAEITDFWQLVFNPSSIACNGVPVFIAYAVCIYWIFRGKVKLDRLSY